MTGNGGNSEPEPATPLYKLFWWIVAPLLAVMQAATLYAERRPLADLAQREQFIMACHEALAQTLPRDTMAFSPIYPKFLHSSTEGYRWEGNTTADGDAGKYLEIAMICEGSPQDPKLQLQMREVSIDDSS